MRLVNVTGLSLLKGGPTPITMQQDNLFIQGSPTIPGLTFRHFQGEEDYPAILEVNTRCKMADGAENDLHTLDTLKYVYAVGPGYDPLKDMLIAEVEGKVISYSRVFCERLQEDGSRIYWHVGFVLPEWRGEGPGHRANKACRGPCP